MAYDPVYREAAPERGEFNASRSLVRCQISRPT